MSKELYVVTADYYKEAEFGGSELWKHEVVGVFDDISVADSVAEGYEYEDEGGYMDINVYVTTLILNEKPQN